MNLFELKPGTVCEFNGATVKLVKQVAAHEGQTWKVQDVKTRETFVVEPQFRNWLKPVTEQLMNVGEPYSHLS